MRNLIKKSLAFLLVAALALTCFVGTLTVSAADAYNANISVTANPVTLGDTEATAIINVAMVEENVGINEALIKVTSTIGAVAKEVELVKDAAGTAYSEEELTALDYVVDYVGNDISDYGLFYLSAKTATYAIPAAFIKVTFTVGADIAAGTYAINIDVPESKVIAATPDEVAVNFIYDNENPVCFTVEDKVVEPVEPTIDTTIQLGRQVLVRETLGIRVYVLTSQLEAYDDYYVEIKSNHYATKDGQAYMNSSEVDLYKYVAEGETAPEGYNPQATVETSNGKITKVFFDYAKITAYEMTAPMTVTIYCQKNGVTVAKSQEFTFTLAERIRKMVFGRASDAVYVDMVNYGAAVQEFFAIKNPNSDLAKNTVLPNAEFASFQQWATKDEDACAALAIKISGGGTYEGTNTTIGVGKALVVQTNNQPRFSVQFPAGYNTSDLSNFRLDISYIDSYGNDKSESVCLADITDFSSNKYYYNYTKVALFDTTKVITATLYNGDEKIYTRRYSVESWIAETGNDSSLTAIRNALMKFNFSINEVLF